MTGILSYPEDISHRKENIQEARIVAQFTINKDDTFNLSYYGQEMIKIDGKEDAVRLNDYGVKMGIKAIYENKTNVVRFISQIKKGKLCP